jgi:stage V sporulation protein B
MKEKASAAKGMFILSFAGMMVKVMSVFYTPLLIKILGLGGYGLYTKTTEVFLFIYALSCMGAQPAVAKVVAEYTALKNPKGAIRVLRIASGFYGVLGTILGGGMILLAKPLSNLAHSPQSAYGIMALGPCIVITSLLAVFRGFMQGKSDMTPIAISQVAEQILNVVISLLCAFILVQASVDLGNAGAQVGTSVGALFACFFVIYCYDRKGYKEEALESEIPDKKIKNKNILRKLLMYSFPITLSAGLQNLGGLVDMFNVSTRLIAAGFSEDQANILYGVPLVVITAIGTTVLPSIAQSIALKDRKDVKRKISYAFKMVFIIAIPSAVGLSMLSTEAYTALYGTSQGSGIMKYGSVILVLMSMTQIQSTVLQGINKLYFVLKTFCIGIVIKIIANFILVGIPGINIYGAIIGNCLWHLVPAILNHREICSIMMMRMPILRLTIKPIFASIAMAATIYACKLPLNFLYRIMHLPLNRFVAIPVTVLLIGVGGLVYIYLIIVTGGITKKDIEGVSPKILKVIPRFMRVKLR